MESDLLSVRTNTAAMKAATAVTMAQRSIETSMERLSTGKRLNSAADDAAGVAIASRLNASLRGTNQSIRNALDAQALLDTAEGAMQETEALLQRIRELAVQAASDTNSSTDRAALDAEKTQLLAEIDRIASTTSWAGQNLLDGTFTSKSFQVGGGTMAVDQTSTSINDTSSSGLNLLSSSSQVKYSNTGIVATSSYPGQNNSADIQVTTNVAVPYHDIFLIGDTTGGADSKVEIAGIEYTVNAGTPAERLADLISQLNGDGISTEIGTVPPGGYVANSIKIDQSYFADYAYAFDTNRLTVFGDPLAADGASNDQDYTRTTYNPNGDLPTLINGYTRPDVSNYRTSLNGNAVDLSQTSTAQAAIDSLDTALQTLNSRRVSLGAISNRFDHIVANNTNIATNIAKSISRIEDADFAAETTNLAKQQIIQQASIAMLSQANASKQNILTLLQG